MNALRASRVLLTGCLLLLALLGWRLAGGIRLEAPPAPAAGAREVLLLVSVTIAPVAAPLISTLIAADRE